MNTYFQFLYYKSSPNLRQYLINLSCSGKKYEAMLNRIDQIIMRLSAFVTKYPQSRQYSDYPYKIADYAHHLSIFLKIADNHDSSKEVLIRDWSIFNRVDDPFATYDFFCFFHRLCSTFDFFGLLMFSFRVHERSIVYRGV